MQSWNGDARLGILESPDPDRWQWVLGGPDTELWMDNWAIAAGAPHPEAAHAFINFILTPENALLELDYIGYHTGAKDIEQAATDAGLEMLDLVFFTPEQVETMHEGEVNDGAGAPRRDLERDEGRRGCVESPGLRPRDPRVGVAAALLRRPRGRWWSGSASATSRASSARTRTTCSRSTATSRRSRRRSSRRSRTRSGSASPARCCASLIGMPVAYWMAVKVRPERRGLLIALVLVPFWTNFLVRTIGWQVHPRARGVGVDAPAGHRPHAGPARDPLHPHRGAHRRRLQLPAADDPAAVRRVRPRRRAAARGVERPRRGPLHARSSA